jgi:hypothetical protein
MGDITGRDRHRVKTLSLPFLFSLSFLPHDSEKLIKELVFPSASS